MISRPTRASSVRDNISLEGGKAIEMNRDGSLRSRSSTLDTGTNERRRRVITVTAVKAKVSFTG